jgi:glycosyltransferase involved in cell wall biosynthesis
MTPSADPNAVLHLLARPADYQTSRVLESLCRPGATPRVMQREEIGPSGRWRNALHAVLGLRRRVGEFGLVQCWDDRALLLAAAAGAKRLIYSPQQHPSPRAIRWLQAVRAYCDVQVVAASTTAQRAFLRRGVPIDRCTLVRPGVDFARVQRRRDPALRAALGIGPEDRVVLLPGESTAAANHRLSVWAGSILHVLSPSYRVLMWGRGPWADHAERLGVRLGQPRMVINATATLGKAVSFESLLPATDLVMLNPTAPVAALPVAVCMAAAMPIVSTAEPSVAELLEDRHTCLMVPEARPRHLAVRVLQLVEEPDTQWKVADAARADAYEHWSLTRSLQAWRELYASLA